MDIHHQLLVLAGEIIVLKHVEAMEKIVHLN